MNTLIKYDLSRKYAIAFVRVFAQNINEYFYDIDNAILLFNSKKQFFLNFIKSPTQQNDSTRCVEQFLQYFHLPHCFSSLINLLLKRNRFYLFFEILECIKSILLDQSNQQEVFVYTAQSLTKDDIGEIEKFMHFRIKKSVLRITCFVSPDLIAGIRIVSNGFLFDCSIRKQLIMLDAILKQERIIYE